jgi:uncharacterized lipoprotein NlpE involved in copper resistance
MERKLTKLFTVLLIVMLACSTVLMGCDRTSVLEETTWKVSEMSAPNRDTVTGRDIETLLGYEITYEFKSKGLVVLSEGSTKAKYGTWSEKDNKITLEFDDEEEILGKIEGDKIIFENEKRKITLIKK